MTTETKEETKQDHELVTVEKDKYKKKTKKELN